MRERFKQKPIVAVLLPILFLLVGLISIYQWNPLKADDQNAHLVDVKVNGKEIDENYSVTEQGTLLEMSAEKPQVLKFLESEKYKVELLNEKGEPLPTEKVSNEKLAHFQDLVKSQQESSESTEQTDQSTDSSSDSSAEPSTSQEVEEIASQIFYVIEDGKKVPYLLLDKEETIWLSITNKTPEEATAVVLEDSNNDKKQPLISFKPKKTETTETSKIEKAPASSESKASSEVSGKQETAKSNQEEKKTTASSKGKEETSSSVKKEETSSSKETEKKSATKTKTTKLTKEEKKRNLAIEQLLDEKYEEKDSFKPIELLAEEVSKREVKDASSPISVTGAKMTIKDGTASFDAGNDNPGYDSGDNNQLVRSFDSIIYLLTFSLEASDPNTTYSDIQYRVDMELPDAYALDSSGKERFNAEVVDSENGELVADDPTGVIKTSKGYMESTINSNGQILLPMIVNVYGAQHGTTIKPTMKITIISAKNDKTGEIEAINKIYDQDTENMSDALDLRETKVSAKPSVNPTLVQGNKVPMSEIFTGLDTQHNHESKIGVGIGITYSLKPIDNRGTNDFRGSTFPNGEIKVTVDSKTIYRFTLTGTRYDINYKDDATNTFDMAGEGSYILPLYAAASSVATSETTGWDQHMFPGKAMDIKSELTSISVPLGKTEEIHSTEPNVSLEEKKKIGVYDTGNIEVSNSQSDMNFTLTNSDYTPVYNPYTYNYASGLKTNDNTKVFSSAMVVVRWSKFYLQYKGSGILDTRLGISKISYEGNTETFDHDADEAKPAANQKHTDKRTTISDSLIPGGNMSTGATYVKNVSGSHPYLGLSSNQRWDVSNGDGTVGQGESNILIGLSSLSNMTDAKEVHSIIEWNANSFEYDLDRDLFVQVERSGWFIRDKTRYGVGRTQNHPNLTVKSKAQLEADYTWYESPEEAVTHGQISAVKFVSSKPYDSFSSWQGAPVKVIGIPGGRDEHGNYNAIMGHTYSYNSSGALIGELPDVGTTYSPTNFDTNGNRVSGHNDWCGDTIFIKPFRIETTTTPENPTYKTNEIVKWKVNGNLLTEAETEYGVRLTTTLPKGLKYNIGSSTDSHGVVLPDDQQPTVNEKADGTTELIWNFSNVKPSEGQSVEVHFETTPYLKGLTFNDVSMADASVKTVGEMWVQGNPSQADTSNETLRTSNGKVNLYQVQQITLTKEVDKSFIEVGNKDPAVSPASDRDALTDITYKVTLENFSSDKLLDVKVLDELPFDTDSLGTDLDGSFTVKSIKIITGSGDITYTNNPVPSNERENPNLVSGSWSSYVPGSSSSELIKNAKGFIVTSKELDVGDSLAFEVTISPTGQKAGNILRNQAAFNSHLDLPVKSNIVQTQVLGRDLTGYVWYDDDWDGLIDVGEEPVGEIPVKLYRTSLVNGSYVKELVKESLTGQQFIDGAGDSLIKTIATGTDKGKYKFENLPEGDYLAEFMVGDIVNVQKVAIVTKQLEGADPTLNSKANPNDFKTPEYNHSVLADLPALLTGTDKVSHITDVNAGLTRLSKIRLFKYEEGTVIDVNGNGKLDPEEIEASTTRALEGAEFQLYKANSEDPDNPKPEDKIGEPVATGEDGWLEFGSLPPGDYTIVETKAPEGFELLKTPEHVTVPTYNYIAIVHVPDKGQTKLPFTGSTKAMRIILIAAACLLVVGMTGVFLHFRPIKVRGGK